MVSATDLRVRFTTRVEDESLRRADGIELVVPGAVKRKALNEILRQLLELALDDEASFEFLVDATLLRGELLALCESKGHGTEKTVPVEYALRGKALKPDENETDVKEWVCAVDALRAEGGPVVVAGSYDGRATVLKGGKVVLDAKVASGAVKSVKWMAPRRMVCAGADGTVRIFQWLASGKLRCLVAGAGTDGQSFECAEASSDGKRLVAGSVTGGLYVFETSAEANSAMLELRDIKRPKTDAKETIAAVPSRELEGHTLAVSSVEYLPSGDLVSGSWDGTVAVWSVETAERVRSVPAMHKAVMDVSVQGDVVAAACADGCVRLLDLRADNRSPIKSIRHAHRGVVSAAQWRPDSAHTIASTGFDSAVKVWDIRATSGFSFKRVGAHGEDGKATCLTWCGPEKMFSGGSDGLVREFVFQ